MRVLFYDFERKINKEHMTSAKKLTTEGVARVLVADSTLILESAQVIAEKGKWLDENCWTSPSGQYRIELVGE